ncbi:hypothetical protein ACF0H5_008974 [Mactra antiquata]
MNILTLLGLGLLIIVSCCYGYPLSEDLWQQTEQQRQQVLNTTFIQGFIDKNLDPTKFGAFMVQDAVYCYYSMEVIAIASAKVTNDKKLQDFFDWTYASYNEYTAYLLKEWHIGDPTTIVLGPACENYVNHLYDVARNMEPIYLVVAMTPCAKLWPWLGGQLNTGTGDFGVYTDWAKFNFVKDSKGFKEYEALIDSKQLQGGIDPSKALDVYSKSMNNEAGFFSLDEVQEQEETEEYM